MANESRILYNNIIKNAVTTTVTTEETGFEKKYLSDDIASTFYRTTAITESTITFDFGAATSIGGVAVIYHSDIDTTLKWESSTDNFSSTSETADMTKLTRTVKEENSAGVLEDVTRRDAHHQAAWNRRYYRVRMQASAGSWMEIGEIYIFTGNYLFDKNFTWRYPAGREVFMTEHVGKSGTAFRTRDSSRDTYSLSFETISTAQKNTLIRDIDEEPYVIFIDGITGDLFYGFTNFQAPTHIRNNRWNLSGRFTESK
jgi:hypothetical protein